MTTPTIPPQWEFFQDVSYYDMWCVRRVNDRAFGQGFHLLRGNEAADLADLLNATARAPGGSISQHCPNCESLAAENARLRETALAEVERNLLAVQYDPAPYSAMKRRIAAMRKGCG